MKTFEVWEVTLDDFFTSYDICVPKDQVDEFVSKLSQSGNVADYGYIHDTDDISECCSLYDKGREIPLDCEMFGDEEEEEE